MEIEKERQSEQFGSSSSQKKKKRLSERCWDMVIKFRVETYLKS
jgi:hypothetical protein